MLKFSDQVQAQEQLEKENAQLKARVQELEPMVHGAAEAALPKTVWRFFGKKQA
ncbi:hypothetical protein SOV_52090 [Sporomusa ovata DSM 2662]|uniref:Uncharacterized protein n=1 Tax=Sporomusa ovata TaxID=2378 RepID=A0A0U1L1L8_9FIRM|nr:hypothetical protein [Sporomusa ovata]EQB27581.1 hypothetical protein SOV_2c04780 [Sporomusa ovata DSM 2662]CQR73435.1 hypothetical protein SpAn4DRAFT_2667 [Sporomusa ovata]